MDNVLPAILPKNTEKAGNLILEIGFGNGEHVRDLAHNNPESVIIGAEPFANGVAALLSAMCDDKTNEVLPEYKNIRI
jgi:tRNA G46 methylase TrmB